MRVSYVPFPDSFLAANDNILLDDEFDLVDFAAANPLEKTTVLDHDLGWDE